MKTLLIIFLLITSVSYSQTDTLTFKAGTYEAGVYVRDANNVVWQTLKKSTVTATPKAGTIWRRITPLPVPVTIESLQAQIKELQTIVAGMSTLFTQMQEANIGYQRMLLEKIDATNAKIDETTYEFEIDDEGIPMATVDGKKLTLKSLISGKKTKIGDNTTNVKIEQQ